MALPHVNNYYYAQKPITFSHLSMCKGCPSPLNLSHTILNIFSPTTYFKLRLEESRVHDVNVYQNQRRQRRKQRSTSQLQEKNSSYSSRYSTQPLPRQRTFSPWRRGEHGDTSTLTKYPISKSKLFYYCCFKRRVL